MKKQFKRHAAYRLLPNTVHKQLPEQIQIQVLQKSLGFSIVELMVSIVIGMVVVLVLMQLARQTEQWNRNASSGSDTQTTGQLAAYVISRDLAEAGGSLVSARCHSAPSDLALSDHVWVKNSSNAMYSFYLPHLPVIITSNGSAGDRIEFIRQSGVAGWGSAPLWKTAAATDPLLIRSFQGFQQNGAMLISRDTDTASTFTDSSVQFDCLLAQISGVTSTTNAIVAGTGAELGFFNILHSPTVFPPAFIVGSDAVYPSSGNPAGMPSAHWVQGVGILQTHRLAVQQDNGRPSLFRETRNFGEADTHSSVKSNQEAADIVYFKAFYGFDNQEIPTGQVNQWLGAGQCKIENNRWSCDGIRNDTRARTAERLIAIRFGIAVRSAQHDRTYGENTSPPPPSQVKLWQWSDSCTLPCVAPTPNEVVYDIPSDLRDYRYRTFQAVVPLRSSIWNAIKPQ